MPDAPPTSPARDASPRPAPPGPPAPGRAAPRRDYGLLGPEAERAVAGGLANAQWYRTDVPREQMKALRRREDGPAIRDTLILFGAMLALALVGIALWPSWWSAPFWLGYGVLYGSAMDSRWHECGHGTAFRTDWMNDAVHRIASFMMVRNRVTWRWSHARHHVDTIVVGRDPEIAIMRPVAALRLAGNALGLSDAFGGWKRMLLNASGRLTPEEESFVPESERPKVVATARAWCAIYGSVIALALASGSWLPLMLVGLPRLYGAWHHILTGVLQHGGLAEDVLDHRFNSRTVYMNPISRFIYWNMNYHVEHHMFPAVPYHRLPELHERVRHDMPAPSASILDGWREVLPALRRQRADPSYRIERTLPATARRTGSVRPPASRPPAPRARAARIRLPGG